ncbi:hypothetical protein ABD76_18415 [Paenibacillus dendritiformis]|uniref:acyl carrier protein n=1 Tax=Paenibacillus dendritiformis TaxID=130049 RepID=UPI0018CC972C|nr:acyl carrier protein [Paenibacillus dendritiformis]MBG9794374.1 hypothetical protein [Paenibacillus dendritiformis]
MEALRSRVIQLVEEMTQQALSEDSLTQSFEELGIDSLMALELAIHLEREFGVWLSEEDLGTIQDLQDILNIAEARKE